jgi:hypothetical protein
MTVSICATIPGQRCNLFAAGDGDDALYRFTLPLLG